jgi:hypothetical protein
MLNVRFQVAGEQQYARAFQVLADDARDLKEPLTRVRDRLVSTVGEQFQSEGQHGGTPWPQLSTAYEQWKQEAFPGRPLLVRSGAMRAAYLADGTRELTNTRLVWGIDTQRDQHGQAIADRAGAHQAGEGHMPQRKIIALTFEDRRAFDRAFVEHFNYLKHRVFRGSR